MRVHTFNKVLLVSLLFGAIGCVNETPKHPVLQFSPKEVEQLSIIRFDPVTGQRWSAEMSKSGPGWRITESPSTVQMIDQSAQSSFVDHLLDALTTLKFKSTPKNGPLEAFGLAPAHWTLKWHTRASSFSLQLGTSQLDRSRFATLGLEPQTSQLTKEVKKWVVSGAAVSLLEQLRGFNQLRLASFTTLIPDEVDEIEVFHGNRPLWYAQRDGSIWTDRMHKEILVQNGSIEKILKQLTTTPIISFIDAPKKADFLKKQASNAFHAKLSGRLGQVNTVSWAQVKDQVIGFNSTREGVFELPKDILKTGMAVKTKNL